MPGIFITYRRHDSSGHAGRLFDRLKKRYGSAKVFMDVAGIGAGADFIDAIERGVAGCDALVAVIGREWLTCTNERGLRRIDDLHDFVRLEIATALQLASQSLRHLSMARRCLGRRRYRTRERG